MRLRHAAALALLGWYLMLPPTTGSGKLDVKAPLSDWFQGSSHDSANECDQVRDALIRHYHADAKAEALFRWSRCVASDDPRLKPK